MASTFCWQCGKPLALTKDGGAVIFREILDPIGNPIRTHIVCSENAKRYFRPDVAEPPYDDRMVDGDG